MSLADLDETLNLVPQVLAVVQEIHSLMRTEQGALAVRTNEDRYLTTAEVMEYTGYKRKTIQRRVADGKLRACGERRDRFLRSDVDAMMHVLPKNATDDEREVAEALARLHAK